MTDLVDELANELRHSGWVSLNTNEESDAPHRAASTIEALSERIAVLEAENSKWRQQGQDEGFAAAVQQLRDMSAMKPRSGLAGEANTLADSLERSRIPCTASLTQEPQ